MDRTFLTTLALVLLTESVSAVVIIGPEEVLIEDKSSANLTCVGSGTNLTAEWRKDGQILSPSDRVQFSAENTSVLISPVRRTDSGEYRCTLSNTNSSNTAAYSLTVNYGPDVRMLGAARVEEGSDILLYCFADSFPFASVTWIINGETVRAALLYILEKSNHSNSGNYTCTAYNDITGLTGTAEHFITVTGKDIDSGLSPGVAAGITVAVICAVELLAVGLYFLIIHLK
ncbi:cell adhesion molecule CEACAM6-like [Salminus brasiliensis]|uniref:cell adhesion molecule CEACAM6-like n=1 Tax=Salminus brasiliensis TaxID=930266 RepID=UPI003B82DB44